MESSNGSELELQKLNLEVQNYSKNSRFVEGYLAGKVVKVQKYWPPAAHTFPNVSLRNDANKLTLRTDSEPFAESVNFRTELIPKNFRHSVSYRTF